MGDKDLGSWADLTGECIKPSSPPLIISSWLAGGGVADLVGAMIGSSEAIMTVWRQRIV